VPPLDKLALAQDVLVEVDRAEGRMPDIGAAFADRLDEDDAEEYRSLRATLEEQLERAVTNAFSTSFLVAAAFALAALVPIAVSRGAVSV
jgi:hypothetical protein